MYSPELVLLLAGAVAAQSTVEVFQVYPESTLTYKSSDSTATTYEHACNPKSGATASSSQASRSKSASLANPTEPVSSSVEDLELVPISALPLATAKARLRRQQTDEDESFCGSYTLIQGGSTWGMHMTTEGLLTVDVNCNWDGESRSADWTCTGSSDGPLYSTNAGTTSSIFKNGDLTSVGEFRTATVLNAPSSSTPTDSTKTTEAAPTGSTPTNASSSDIPTGEPDPTNDNVAASLPLPTGAMALVGGAAGLLVAALAL